MKSIKAAVSSLALISLLCATAALADAVSTVKDINQVAARVKVHSTIRAGENDFLLAEDSGHGVELWVLGATPQQTHIVKDIYPGPGSAISYREQFDEMYRITGNRILFSANDGVHGDALWVSDGTESGTYMVHDFSSDENDGFPVFQSSVVDRLLIRAADALWLLDPANLSLEPVVTDVPNGGLATSMGVFSERCLAEYGCEPWITVAAGSSLLADIAPGALDSRPGLFTLVGSQVFFSIRTEGQTQLWRTNGTAEGTHVVRNFGEDYIFDIRQAGTRAILRIYDLSMGDETLWASDGTSAGTVQLASLIDWHFFQEMPDGKLLFSSRLGGALKITDGVTVQTLADVSDASYGDANGATELIDGVFYFLVPADGMIPCHLWRSNGTAEGTYAVDSSYLLQREAMARIGNSLLLLDAEQNRAIVSNGSAAGTTPGASLDASFALVGEVSGGVLINAEGSPGAYYRTDGTQSGTTLHDVRAAGVTEGADIDVLGRLGSQILFSANDGVHGKELWRTDGTDAGTFLVKDLVPGGEGPYQIGSRWNRQGNGIEVNGVFIFPASAGTSQDVRDTELWRTDGTEAGTFLLRDIVTGAESSDPSEFVNMGGVAYFVAQGSGGEGLWRSDGTPDGTYRVRGDAGFRSPYHLTVVGDRLFMSAYSPGFYEELWVSDGTFAGTNMVLDISPEYDSSPSSLTAHDGKLYFYAGDGVNGRELWTSDGTAAGTAMVEDINPSSGSETWGPMFSINGLLYFKADDGAHGDGPWRSDGTAEGTYMLADVSVGYEDMVFAAAGSNVMFSVRGTVWRTDGTVAGTQDAGLPAKLYDLKSVAAGVVGSGYWQGSGNELTLTNGTPEGTLLREIMDGTASSGPDQFLEIGGRIYFVANTAQFGRELLVLDTEGIDLCPGDVGKTAPGICGCGTPDLDWNGDGQVECSEPDPVVTPTAVPTPAVNPTVAPAVPTQSVPALSSLKPAKPVLKQAKANLSVKLTAQTGVKYVVTYTVTPAKKTKAKIKPKKVVSRKPLLTIKKLKAGDTVKLRYHYQAIDTSSLVSQESVVAKLKIKAVKK